MASDRPTPSVGPILRFQPDPPRTTDRWRHTVVLDTAWTPERGAETETVVGLRDVADRVLADRDLLAESASRLDDWASASGVVDTMSIEGTSFWYQGRVRHGLWLHERLLWLALVDDLVSRAGASAIECEPGCDEGLTAIAELIAVRDGIPFRLAGAATPRRPRLPSRRRPGGPPTTGHRQRPPLMLRWTKRPGAMRRLRRRLMDRLRPSDAVRRRRFVANRLGGARCGPGPPTGGRDPRPPACRDRDRPSLHERVPGARHRPVARDGAGPLRGGGPGPAQRCRDLGQALGERIRAGPAGRCHLDDHHG